MPSITKDTAIPIGLALLIASASVWINVRLSETNSKIELGQQSSNFQYQTLKVDVGAVREDVKDLTVKVDRLNSELVRKVDFQAWLRLLESENQGVIKVPIFNP